MKLTSLALASALALSAAGASLAQPAPANAPGAAGAHAWGERDRPDPARMAQMAQRHAERLRAVLQLRPDQEPALQALMAAMRPPAGAMERWRSERAEAQGLTTPQRLDRMQARMAEHQTDFARRADAIKRFYAQLSPSQQRAFDALHQGHGMGMMKAGHHMHGMGEGPGMGRGGPG